MLRWPNRIICLLLLLVSLRVQAQKDWPRQITLPNTGVLVIYEPQAESLAGSTLHSRAAISLRTTANADPIFGVMWSDARLNTDKSQRMVTLESLHITDIRFPDKVSDGEIDSLKTLLETEIPKWTFSMSLDDITATIEQEQRNNADPLSTDPPQIIYTTTATTLVVLDGDPVVQKDDELKMEKVVNSPYLIVKHDNQYYLYGAQYWYRSASVTAGWQPITDLPGPIRRLDKKLREQAAKAAKDSSGTQPVKPASPPAIIVSTTPAEIIQSNGAANFASVAGTGLLYMSNSDDNVFLETANQLYYVLLSGRWYRSSSLNGPWTFVASDNLPGDFAKIPPGSDKDAVLASVAGTPAARQALMDAAVPQTAKVDRTTATANVIYDGAPQFSNIEGTDLQEAVNTSSTVLHAGDQFYCVENGVWFVSNAALGPWAVATIRPAQVDRIPPTSPSYNTRYVYIYDVTPQYCYMGYTPGYLSCYPFGPTVVYGTGYHYRPWFGNYYFPRPWTWGFGMCYNPWTGWSFGYDFYNPWFDWGFGWGWGGGFGGWWGPRAYRPPFRPWHGPQYGGRPMIRNQPRNMRDIRINNQHNNIYARRNGIQPNNFRSGFNNPGNTRPGGNNTNPGDRTRPAPGQGSGGTTRPAAGNGFGGTTRPAPTRTATPNNIYTDRNGNIYQRQQNGDWQQRRQNQWQAPSDANRAATQQAEINRQQLNRAAERPTFNPQPQFNGGGRGGFGGGAGAPPRGGGGGFGGGGRVR